VNVVLDVFEEAHAQNGASARTYLQRRLIVNLRWKLNVLGSSGALMLTGSMANAGDLNPPAGPIAPTMKTLQDIEPRIPINAVNTPGDADSLFKITQPGSYYLTGNVQGVAGRKGIEVVASHVTIDMRGFDLVGAPGSLAGIDTNNGGAGGILGTVIRDGTIRGWGSDGIKGDQSEGNFIHLVISEITGRGIAINTNSTIDNCLIYGCSLDGISTSNNVVIQNTICGGNGGSGISAGTSSTVTRCAGYINAGAGIVIWGGKGTVSYCNATLNNGVGISGLDGSTISNCHADNNGQIGISVGEGGVIAQCASNDNIGSGISAGATSTITACSAWSNNGTGIVSSDGTVTGCTARENGSDGISASGGSVVEGCTVAANADDGIVVGFGSVVTRCTSRGNTGDGIQCSSDCRITDNSCDGNGAAAGDGAGIHVTSSDCRIEGNNVTDNDRGIDVDISGNLIIRNSASGNTSSNYEIVANNKVGPIVLAPDSVAISGDTGGAGVGTTNPWANFSY
jgi:parallel beta-helix repeat protein